MDSLLLRSLKRDVEDRIIVNEEHYRDSVLDDFREGFERKPEPERLTYCKQWLGIYDPRWKPLSQQRRKRS